MPTKGNWKARYSGPFHTGVCTCGHAWSDHHLGCVANQDYLDQTKENYVPQECEYWGFNEMGGKDREGKDHCHRYTDEKESTDAKNP